MFCILNLLLYFMYFRPSQSADNQLITSLTITYLEQSITYLGLTITYLEQSITYLGVSITYLGKHNK